MSAAKTTSRGVDEDILTPLLIRLDDIDKSLDDAPQSVQQDPSLPAEDYKSKARLVLESIKFQVRKLKDNFDWIVETETKIRSGFDPVERLISQVLEEKTQPQLTDHQIHQKLDRVKKEVEQIKAKISAVYNLPNLDEKLPVAQFPAAWTSSSPGTAALLTERTRKMLQEPHMRHLQLSVGRLEEQLKGSILSLAAFPEGAVIKKRLLIHWWMSEGFVLNAVEGKERFEKLVNEGFIVPEKRKHCDKVHRCRVRPWMQYFLAGEASSSAFLELDSNDFSASRRACLRRGKMRSTEFHPEVRAIFNIDQKYVEIDQGWFAVKKKLRTLQLGQWKEFEAQIQMAAPMDSHIEVNGAEHFEGMVKCKNLRYISFRGISGIESLHDNIGKLSKLMILDLRACHNLEKLGQGITKLDQLQYLDVSGCHLLNGMPKGLAKLKRLQVLKGFVIANSNSKDPCRLQDMAKLKDLRKLSISIGKMAMTEQDEFQELAEFKALVSLTITWAEPTSKKEGGGRQALAPSKKEDGHDDKEALTAMKEGNKDDKEVWIWEKESNKEEALTSEKEDGHDDKEALTATEEGNKDELVATRKKACSQELPSSSKKKADQEKSVTSKKEDDEGASAIFGHIEASVLTTGKAVHEEATVTLKEEVIGNATATPGRNGEGYDEISVTALATKEEDNQPSVMEQDHENNKPSKIVTKFDLPPKLEKLDLVCFPWTGFTQWVINPKRVRKLYIRGGKLTTLGDEADWDWKVEVLRLRFLKDFHYDKNRIHNYFNELYFLEVCACPNFKR